MIPIRPRTVRSKLVMIVVIANLVALIMAAGALLYAESRSFKDSRLNDIETKAGILADAAIPALDFNDASLAEQSLALLNADPRILAAALYTADGRPYAQFSRKGAQVDAVPALAGNEGVQIARDRILLNRRVQTADRILGSLYIEAEFGIAERLQTYLGTLFAALILSGLAGVAISLQLRRWITRPIQLVTSAATEVVERRDFSVQAKKVSDDEVGYLVDAFNAMLSEIASRTEAIEQSRQSLEREVQERRQVQQSLEFSELRHRTLVSALSSVIWTADASGALRGEQPGWERYTGQSREIWRHLGWRSAFHPDDQGRLDRSWAIALHDQAAFEFEGRLWHASSSQFREVVLSGVPLNPGSGAATEWIGAIIDVEDRRAAEREVLKLNSELEQRVSERTAELKVANQALEARTRDAEAANQSKAEFLANMSHEIRTPMNAVLGLAYLLERRPLSSDDLGLVRKIRLAGRSLQTIINDILDFSKIEAGRLEIERAPFLLNDVLDSLSSIMSANAGSKDIELSIAPAPEVQGRLLGDALRLEQVLVNLTGNAIKFTETGSVAVSVTVIDQADDSVRLRFCIRDTGIGIPADKLPHIFSAFAQADSSTTRRFGGTGLGLAICRHLVAQMGGELGVESKLGQGSEFWFSLPFGRADEPNLAHPELERLDVLIADDCEPTRDSLVLVARSVGWRATAVESGQLALQSFLSRHGESTGKSYDVVVLDWKMPEMDGLEAARQIRAKAPNTHCPIVIMATAYSRDELSALGADTVIDAFLSKPVTSSNLYNAVADAQRRRGRLHPRIAEANDHEPRLDGVRVLVVDDSDINREVAQRILSSELADVFLAEDGAQAIDWLSGEGNEVDIVLMDVQMPVLDGYQAARRIRSEARWQSLPIVALTAGAFRSQVEAAKAAGMDDFVAKPFDVDSLIEVIRRRVDARPDTAATEPMLAPVDTEQAVSPSKRPGPAVDYPRAIALWRDEDVLRRYLERFARDYADADTRLQEELRQGSQRAATYVHKLKGAAGSVALMGLFHAANELEAELIDRGRAGVSLLAFSDALRAALTDIRAWAARSSAVAPIVSADAQRPALQALLASLDDEDSRGIDQALLTLKPLLPSEEYEALRGATDAFDFTAATTRIRALLRALPTPPTDVTP